MKPEEYEAAIEFAYGKKAADMESIDSAKIDFQTRTVLRSEAAKDKAIIGSILGPFETQIKSAYKDIIGDEVSDSRKKFNESETFSGKLNLVADLTKQYIESRIAEAKTSFATKPDERVQKLETEIGTWKEKVKQEETARLQAVDASKKWESDFVSYKKDGKIKELKSTFSRDVPIILDHITDPIVRKYTMEGFENDFNNKYKVELTEDEKDFLVFDAKTGQKVGNPARSGEFLSFREVLAMEVKTAGFDKKNPVQGQRAQFTPQSMNNNPQQPQQPQGQSKVRRPGFLK